MRFNIWEREDHNCRAGTQWYVCSESGFRGCCSVDACHLSSCPDSATSSVKPSSRSSSKTSSTSSISVSTTVVLNLQTPGSPPSSTSASITPTTSQSTSKSLPITSDKAASQTSSIVSSTATETVAPVVSLSPEASSPLPSSSSSPSPSISRTLVIAGVVSGIVAAAILSIIVWICLRRRKQMRSSSNSTSSYVASKQYALDRSFGDEEQHRSSDVFAPFGGYHKAVPATVRPTSQRSVATHATTATNTPELQEQPNEDEPLPDPEKSSFTAPPAHEHPAYHPLPGRSSEVPTYHPGLPIASPEIAETPSYLAHHPSLLSQYPDRTNSAPPTTSSSHAKSLSSPTLPTHSHSPSNISALSTLPSQRRAAALTSMSPAPLSSASSVASRHNSSRSPFSVTPPMMRQTSMATICTSPIRGRSELPAEVPEEAETPTHYRSNPDLRHGRFACGNSISRDNSTTSQLTNASTYSIPIGLGSEATSPRQQWAPLSPLPELSSERSSTHAGVSSPDDISKPIQNQLSDLPAERRQAEKRTSLGPSYKASSESLGKGKDHAMAWATYGYQWSPIAEQEEHSPMMKPEIKEKKSRWSGSTKVQSPAQEEQRWVGRE